MTIADSPHDLFEVGAPSVVNLGPVRQARRPSMAGAVKVEEVQTDSPTVPFSSVVKSVGVALALVLLFGSKGIVAAGHSMQPGFIQSVTLDVGNDAGDFDGFFHLTFAWTGVETALGRTQQSGTPPLLQTHHHKHHSSNSGKGGNNGNGGLGNRGHHKKNKGGKSKHHKMQPPALVAITKSRPLRLLITGDSLVGYMGPQILNSAHAQGAVTGWTDTHDGTGLTTPSFVDWSLLATQQVSEYHPEAIVVMIGGNDFENMVLGNKFFEAGSKSWTKEYERRAEIVMRNWIRGGVRRVYWLSMPPAKRTDWSRDYHQIDVALKAAAKHVPGVEYVNVLKPITNHGRYADYVTIGGTPTLIREPDGVHLNIAGSQLVTNDLIPIIKREWKFGWGAMARAARGSHHTHSHRAAKPTAKVRARLSRR